MRSVGKAMQLMALTLAPIALFLQLARRISVAQLLLMGLGLLCLFYIGRIIEGYSK
jgi:hypothetical protein